MSNDTPITNVGHEAERLVATIGIPPCPAIVINIVREMGRPEPDYMRVADLILSDGGLAAVILKTVNSPFFGLQKKAQSVHEACIFLGLRNTSLVIAGLLLKRLFPEGDGPRMKEYWAATSEFAATMTALAPQFRGLDSREVYTYALFRDCGRAALMLREYRHGIACTAIPPGATTELDDASGTPSIDHAWVGCLLAQSWHLPMPMCEAILHHHAPARAMQGMTGRPGTTARLVALGILADHIHTMQAGQSDDPAWDAGAPLVEAVFDITQDDLPDLIASLGNVHDLRAA